MRYLQKRAAVQLACTVLTLWISNGIVHGATLEGKVVRVADGDTVTLLDVDRRQHTIRLSGIDAPERLQPYGQQSRKHLAHGVLGKTVRVEYEKADRYGRLVGKVMDGERDANLAQIQAGLAWHYKRYQSEQVSTDRETYDLAEKAARQQRQGLWHFKEPEAPWDFRMRKRAGQPAVVSLQ